MSVVPHAIEAKELTPEQQQARAQHCANLEAEVKAGLRAGRLALWQTASALSKFDMEQGWLALGYETKGEWLAQPEITMSRSTFDRLVRCHREYVEVRQLPEATVQGLDLSKAAIVLPAIQAGQVTVEDAVSDVESLGANDLREKYNPKPAPVPDPDPDPASENGHIGVETDEEPVALGDVDDVEDTIEAEARDTASDTNGAGEGLSRAETAPFNVEAWADDDDVLRDAVEDWSALRAELESGLASGAPAPRVAAATIRTGLRGAELIMATLWKEATADDVVDLDAA